MTTGPEERDNVLSHHQGRQPTDSPGGRGFGQQREDIGGMSRKRKRVEKVASKVLFLPNSNQLALRQGMGKWAPDPFEGSGVALWEDFIFFTLGFY